jgi:serine/threonine-protein kinase
MERIGEYVIRRLVGEGGMGRVYEAEERLSERKVALKVLRPELTRDEEGRTMFLSEMRILAHLEHENLVRSLASLEHEGQLVLVLEYLEGRTLRDTLTERGALPWTEAVQIASQVASALTVAHEQDPAIVHRDLKPENIMVLEGSSIKVMDFGVAKVLENARATATQSVGTLQYMSPEQIDARGVDTRTDLYALGLVLYEMLSGEAPFRSASPRELLNLQCTAEPPALDVEAPQGILDLVFRLLAKKPEDRPASARDVVAALRPFKMDRKPKADEEAQPVSAKSPPEAKAEAKEPKAAKKEPPRADTVALLAKKSRDIPGKKVAVLVMAAALLSGLVTYGVRYYASSHGGTAWVAPASAAEPAKSTSSWTY